MCEESVFWDLNYSIQYWWVGWLVGQNVFLVVQLVHCIKKLVTKYKNQGNWHRGDSGKGEPGEN